MAVRRAAIILYNCLMPSRSHTYDLFIRGRAAAKAGEKAEARRYLERVLNLNPPEEERMEALYWLAEISEDPKEQRDCLEEILANNLGDARARRKLAILDGRLKPEEIVDPDRIPAPRAGEMGNGAARSFTCPKCGARMVYAPDGKTLLCEYCESREQLGGARPSRGGESDDFIVAMATAKAQRKPVQARAISCRGCGSNFILPPHIITQTCPYCATPYALEQVEMRQLDAPDGIIPFTIGEQRAKQALRAWFQQADLAQRQPRVTRGLGIYLPVWLFDVGGQIDWTGQIYKEKRAVPVSGARVVGEYGLLVPATQKLGADLRPAFWQFDLSVVQPFDLRFLADWMAETFTISAADAALEARRQAQEKLKRQVQAEELDQAVQNFTMRTANMLVESYRLVLLPVWLASYTLGADPRRYELLINGQTAEVLAQKPDGGVTGWVKNLLA
jgi:tetratricopeptide (TPR) repeat protein